MTLECTVIRESDTRRIWGIWLKFSRFTLEQNVHKHTSRCGTDSKVQLSLSFLFRRVNGLCRLCGRRFRSGHDDRILLLGRNQIDHITLFWRRQSLSLCLTHLTSLPTVMIHICASCTCPARARRQSSCMTAHLTWWIVRGVGCERTCFSRFEWICFRDAND